MHTLIFMACFVLANAIWKEPGARTDRRFPVLQSPPGHEIDDTGTSGGVETKVDALAEAVDALYRRVEKLEENIRDGGAEADLRFELEEIGYQISNLEIQLSMSVPEDVMHLLGRIIETLAGFEDGDSLRTYIEYLVHEVYSPPEFDPEEWIAKKMLPPRPAGGLEEILEGIRGRLDDLSSTINEKADDTSVLGAFLNGIAAALEDYARVRAEGGNFAEFVESQVGTGTSSTSSTSATPTPTPSTPAGRRNAEVNRLSEDEVKRLKDLALQIEVKRVLDKLTKDLGKK